MTHLNKDSRGFTIAELMIATAVFGVVLLVIATAILQLSRVYYKGVNETRVQTTARSIIDTLSQSIQFSGGIVTATPASPTPGNSYAFCIGNKQYSYTLGFQLADNPSSSQTYHALVAKDAAGCTGALAAQDVRVPGVVGTELLAPKMRLAKLEIIPTSTAYYTINVRIVYGNDDLVYSPSNPSDVNGYRQSDAKCRVQQQGTQFCAVSEITAAVAKRVK